MLSIWRPHHPIAVGGRHEDVFNLYPHPLFMTDLARVPLLALYQMVLINGGEFSSPDDAEIFGVRSAGLSRDGYHPQIGELADQLPGCASPS